MFKIKVHLTPNFFWSQINKHVLYSNSSKKMLDLVESSIFCDSLKASRFSFKSEQREVWAESKLWRQLKNNWNLHHILLRGFVRFLWKLSGTNRFCEVGLTQNSKMSSSENEVEFSDANSDEATLSSVSSSSANRRHFVPPQSINREKRSAGWS